MAEPCGFNLRGAARRTCEAGQWSALGECWNPDECDDGTTRAVPSACGLNERGTSAQVCVQGAWRDGSCDDPDTCEDGATSVDTCPADATLVQDFMCEEGSPVAVAECWLSECEDSEVDTRLCGINGNGKQTRKCWAQRWQAFGRCVDRDKCLLGSTREVACGFNQRGKRAETCRARGGAAAYYADPEGCQDPDACQDGTTWSLPCGDAGENEVPVVCVEGQWAKTGECGATE